MKLTCLREDLLKNINIVSKAVSPRTTLPILECILLKAENGTFKLTANDLELGIESANIPADISQDGIIALEAKLFFEIIRKTNGESVSILTDEKNAAVISCGSSEFKIMGQNGEEFPALPEVEKNTAYVLNQNELRNMIRQTIFSIAQDESKPVLTGELLELKKEKASLVSVDGYRISYKQTSIKNDAEEKNVIIPGKTLNELSKILSTEEDDKVSVYVTDKHILFNLSDNIVVSRLIEGDFIKYEQSFTEDYKTKIYVNRSELAASLERVSLISRDVKKTPVKLEISQKSLVLTSQTEMGTAFEQVEIECDGDDLKIAFNPKYLLDALKSIEEEKVSIQFTTSLSPCIIRPLEGEGYQYLILPLRM